MVIQLFTGLGIGHNVAYAIKKIDELKQGKNDSQASIYQIQGLLNLTSLSGHIVSLIPSAPVWIIANIINSLLPVAGLITFPASAMAKQGKYEDGVKYFDALMQEYCPKMEGLFPQKLDETRVKLLTFIADNSSTITNVALALGTVALPFLGFEYLAVGIGAPLVYDVLEKANLVPERIKIVAEKCMPNIANASLLVGGGPFAKVMALASLSNLMPGNSLQKNIGDYVQKKIDKVCRKHIQDGLRGPTLDEIDAPWLQKLDLSFDDINYILDKEDQSLYEINPAHCSKPAHIGVDLPKNTDFKSFLTFFEKFDWTKRYQILFPVFRDDDRFIDFLKEKFPTATEEYFRDNFDTYIEKLAAEVNLSQEEYLNQYFDEHLLDLLKKKFPQFAAQHYRDNFEKYIEKLASEANLSKEQFLAEQLSQQINDLVSILCKEKVAKGFAYDLEDAIDSCSTILGYLHSKPDCLHVEVEDILIKLAVEGGDYCARGIKRAAAEITLGIIVEALPEKNDPLKVYELNIRKQLQLLRQQIMQNIYSKMIEGMAKLAKEGINKKPSSIDKQTIDPLSVEIAQDIHTMDLYRNYLCLGFCPLTSNERSLFGIMDMVNWALYTPIRSLMYAGYYNDLNKAIKEEGEVNFSIQMSNKINRLEHLSSIEKEALIEKLVMCEEGEKTLKAFQRLFFVMEGVLTIKPMLIDWIEVSNDSLFEEKVKKELDEWEII